MDAKDIMCLVISGVLILLSVQYRRGKWLGSIAGYNTLSEEAGKDVDILPYAKRISTTSLSLGSLLLALAFENRLREISSPIFTVVLGALIVFAAISFLRLIKFVFSNGR